MAKSMLMVAAVAVILMLTNGATAEKLTVGDDSGWTIPPSSDFYSSWAAKHTFAVDDTLEFKFATGTHTVAMVTSKDAYEKCDATLDTNAKITKQGPAEITLDTNGEFFFFCTVPGHCLGGQKFGINVTAAGPKPPIEPAKDSSAFMPGALTLSTLSVAFVASLLLALRY